MEKKFNQYVRKVKLSASRLCWSLLKLPADFYTHAGKKYVCVIFFPGLGEKGSPDNPNDAAKLLTHSPSGFVNEGKDFVISHPVTGEKEDMIIISIQHDGDVISPAQLDYCIQTDDLLKDRVKARFITGLSQGGAITTQYMRRSLVHYIEKLSIAGLIPMSPFKHGANVDWFPADKNVWGAFNATNTPVFAFCGANDGGFTTFTKEIQANVKTPDTAVVIRDGIAHAGWKDQYNPDKKWLTINHMGVSKSLNIYEWMLYVMPPAAVVEPAFTLDSLMVSVDGPAIVKDTVIKAGPVQIYYKVK